MLLQQDDTRYNQQCKNNTNKGAEPMRDKRCGAKLNQRRKEMGLKVKELADMSHVQPGYMRQILSGYVPSLQVLIHICRALNITTDYIFEISGDGRDGQIMERVNKLTPKQKDLLIHLLDSFHAFVVKNE